MKKFLLKNLASASVLLAVSAARASDPSDPFLWLEDIHGKQALDWVKAHNDKALSVLTQDSRYVGIEKEIMTIMTATDRIPSVFQVGKDLYNLWQDETHVQGILRKTTLEQFRRPSPRWETVIDIDQLSKAEKKRWVYKGLNCLAPQYRQCLLSLSEGGKDAVVIREFDLKSKRFVKDGFGTPEAKTDIAWINSDELLIGSDFGPGTLTESGYPRQLKVWHRGTKLENAKQVFETSAQTMGVWPSSSLVAGKRIVTITKALDFYNQETFVLNSQNKTQKVALPTDASIWGIVDGYAFVSRREAWKLEGHPELPAGTLIAVPANGYELHFKAAQVVWQPTAVSSLASVSVTKEHGILVINDQVKSKLFTLQKFGKIWKTIPVAFPANGEIALASTSDFSNDFYVSYQDFLTPPTLYRVDIGRGQSKMESLKSKSAAFDAKDMVTEQFFVASADGVQVPYFVIRKKDIPMDGSNPTILYGYGGFMDSLTPYYLSHIGKTWLERGGVYVISNIRGGGEFGPAWHQAALKEKRQNAYNDFYAIAEDLIQKGITRPEHLGIYGGSNGGLLVGVAATQRPDLFNGVVCAVPLLDMLRYHKLLAGASWMGEYGNPDVPAERAYIEKYSPYQNIFPGKKYPEIFFTGSTADDRVHPGHARKMAAKLESLGYPVYFFENMEGGHGGAANIEQRAKVEALRRVYFWKKLGRQP